MRAGVGAICGLAREVRFFAEADFVMTRLGGALFVVELGAVAAGGLELPVCAAARSGESKRNAPQESSAAEMEEITNLCARIIIRLVHLGNDSREKDREHALVIGMPQNLEHYILSRLPIRDQLAVILRGFDGLMIDLLNQ